MNDLYDLFSSFKCLITNKMRRKWYITCIIVGLLPLGVRITIGCFCPLASIKIEDVTVDLITFTLVICITNVNELIYNTKVRVKDNVGLIVSSGLTLIFMLIFLTLTYLSSFIEGITNFVTIFIATLLLALGNFFLTCKMIDNNILYIDGDN